MGGPDSGERRDRSARDLTENYLTIDVRRLQREDLLRPGRSYRWKWAGDGERIGSVEVRVESERIDLSYRTREADGGDWLTKAYPVRLEWTPCHFGGSRPWFLCPISGCSRRVAILYGGPVFACRHCHQLVYRCQREAPEDRAARRADKIRVSLGWPQGLWSPNGGKKKGMHWRTFGKLTVSYETAAADSLAGLMCWLRDFADLGSEIPKG